MNREAVVNVFGKVTFVKDVIKDGEVVGKNIRVLQELNEGRFLTVDLTSYGKDCSYKVDDVISVENVIVKPSVVGTSKSPVFYLTVFGNK